MFFFYSFFYLPLHIVVFNLFDTGIICNCIIVDEHEICRCDTSIAP